MSTLKKIISILNNDIFINSVLIQFPVLKHLNKLSLLNSIKFVKDVDLLNPFNFGCYMSNYFNIIIPSTAASILFILEKMKIRKCGTKSLIFGFSNIVGKPIVLELMSLGLTISIVSKMDKQYINIVKNSDLIILAVGIANFFSISSVSYGAIVIDIGINESFSDFVIGDSFLDNNEDIASFIVPVPGGVGPLTVSSLLFNFVKLYVNKNFTIVV
jgi:methylenetetrahydrofolate dehydrogenase (NADP+)/methenyltetrahydrofolate cyclohydrolase